MEPYFITGLLRQPQNHQGTNAMLLELHLSRVRQQSYRYALHQDPITSGKQAIKYHGSIL